MDCPKHPGKNSLVTCMECGKSFCRICDPPHKTGQYCPVCHEKLIARFAEKPVKKNGKKKPASMKSSAPKKQIREKAREKKDVFNKKVKEKASAVASLPRKGAVGTKNYSKDRFPVMLVEKQTLEDLPPFKEMWLKSALLVVGGATVWALVTILAQQRNPITSIIIAVLISVGVVYILGMKNDIRVAVFCLLLVMLALMIGEFTVQILVRLSVVKKMDTMKMTIYSINYRGAFYKNFLFKVIVWRMLPSAVVAFLIGLWPLSKRPSWKGFGKLTEKEPTVEPTA